MKKKIFLALLGLVCALCCTLGMVACDDNSNEATGLLVAKTGEQSVGEELNINITYGEKPNLDYKLYLSYKNGETKEVSLTDEKLTVVECVYSGINGSTEIEKLPDEYLVGMYTLGYEYPVGKSRFRVYVLINVARAESGAFSVAAQERNWVAGEDTPDFALKNPKGSTVQVKKYEDALLSNDTNGMYTWYVISKADYVAFTDAQKTDYDHIMNYSGYKWIYAPNDVCELSAGEYMLLATVDKTYNYSHVVTPAVAITVREAA